jgi:hypothetical protein
LDRYQKVTCSACAHSEIRRFFQDSDGHLLEISESKASIMKIPDVGDRAVNHNAGSLMPRHIGGGAVLLLATLFQTVVFVGLAGMLILRNRRSRPVRAVPSSDSY